MSKPAGSSKVWDFFIMNAIDNTKVNCFVCSDKITSVGKQARSFGTSAMLNHLRYKHQSEYKQYAHCLHFFQLL